MPSISSGCTAQADVESFVPVGTWGTETWLRGIGILSRTETGTLEVKKRSVLKTRRMQGTERV